VNISIFSMIVVDSFLLHQECTGSKMKQLEYYQELLSALIDNCYDNGVVLQWLAEKKEKCIAANRDGGDFGAGPPYHTDQMRIPRGQFGKHKYRQL
jgi:hypothetical protein